MLSRETSCPYSISVRKRGRKMNKGALVIVPVIIVVLVAFGGMYTVDETEQVVVTLF
jgi:regulator of protease activity HflC (stomatin/prohibitin superfamily)